MGITTLVVIAIGIAVAYIFLSGSGVKLFGKKEHKVKASKSNEEKYKDVIPQEKEKKKEKEEKKEQKVKLGKAVKKEKLKDEIKKELDSKTTSVPMPSGTAKVTKITKEDFEKNNMAVPTSLLTEEEKKQATAKTLPKAKEQPHKPYDFGFGESKRPSPFDDIGGFGSKNPFDDFGASKNPFGSPKPLGADGIDAMFDTEDDEDDPFAGVDIDNLLSELRAENGAKSEDGLPKFPKPAGIPAMSAMPKSESKYNQFSRDDYFAPQPSFAKASGESPFTGKSLRERFEEVFGNKFEEMGGTELGKEVLIGDILGGPRATANRAKRAEREKRNKWMH